MYNLRIFLVMYLDKHSSHPRTVMEPHGRGSTGIFFQVERLIFEGESPYQKILIFENRDLGKVLLLDGMVMTTEGDGFFYHEMLVHPAMTVHPHPRKILVIGGGDGGTVTELLRYPEVSHIVQVEIDELVVNLCKEHFPRHRQAFSDPRVTLLIAEGLEYLKNTSECFDLIFVDGSDPVGPAATLFSREFLLSAREHLHEEGIFVTQSESPFYYQDVIRSLVKELRSLYPQVELYLGPVPTYPSGLWSYLIATRGTALLPRRYPPEDLHYYHPGLFPFPSSLPSFVEALLK